MLSEIMPIKCLIDITKNYFTFLNLVLSISIIDYYLVIFIKYLRKWIFDYIN